MVPETSTQITPYRLLTDPVSDSLLQRGDPLGDEEALLRAYWRVVLKYRYSILGFLLVVVATTMIVVVTTRPRYTAVASIEIERHAPKMAPVQEVQQIDAGHFDKYDYYQTQYQILESRSIAARVIKTLRLDTDDRFLQETKGTWTAAIAERLRSLLPESVRSSDRKVAEMGVDSRLINRYLKMLVIDPERNSRLVRVAFTSHSPDLSAEVSNRHVQEYMSASLDQRLQMTTNAKEFLESELAKAKDRVVAAEVGLNAFRKSKGVISLDGDKSDVVSERLEDLNKRFTEAQAGRIKLEGQYRLIKHRAYQSLPDVLSSNLISELKQQASKIEAERAELSHKFTPAYPKMAELIARDNQLRKRIDAEVGKIVAGIESGYIAAKNQEEELGRQLEKQRQAALSQKDLGADYETLKRDVDTARSLYASLLERLKDMDVAGEIKVSNVYLVDKAAPPLKPSHPKRALSLLFATVVGLAGGLGLAFLREYLDNTLRTPEEVESRLGLPTLGVVPMFDNPQLVTYGYGARLRKIRNAAAHRGRGSSSRNEDAPAPGANGNNQHVGELVVSTAPQSIVAEAYRAIRTGILLSSADKPPQVIVFTSGMAGEGKTVSVINQSLTLAQGGGRVLIIDADIRKPRVHRLLNIQNGHGLSTYLTGQSTAESVVHQVPLKGGNGNGSGDSAVDGGQLFVIPAGPLPPNPAELLGSRRMRNMLQLLRQEFDYILIDTPPVLPVSDAVPLAVMSDGVVLVIRGQHTPVAVSRKSLDRLLKVRAKVLGVVLNGVDVTSGDYSDYGHYYAYYSDRSALDSANGA